MLSCDEDPAALQVSLARTCNGGCMSAQAKTLGMQTWRSGTPESKRHSSSPDSGERVPQAERPWRAEECGHGRCRRDRPGKRGGVD